MDTGRPRLERRSHLQSKFGFDCACALCSLTGNELEASNVRQLRIREINSTMQASRGQPETVALVSEKLRLLKAEGLPVEWAHMDMVRAFSHCCDHQEFAAARKWMRRAIKSARTMLGDDAKEVHDLNQILQLR